MSKHILILGNNGIVGRFLTSSLRKYPTLKTSIPLGGQLTKNCLFKKPDKLSRYIDDNKIDVVINCASMFSKREDSPRDNLVKNEVRLSESIFYGVTGSTFCEKYLCLNSALMINNPLGQNSYEEACRKKHKFFKSVNTSIEHYELILNNIYALHDSPDRLIPQAIRTVESEGKLRISHPQASRNFLFCHDFLELILLIIKSDLNSGSYQVFGAETVSVLDLTILIFSIFNSNPSRSYGDTFDLCESEVDIVNASQLEMPDTVKNVPLEFWRARTMLREGLLQIKEARDEESKNRFSH